MEHNRQQKYDLGEICEKYRDCASLVPLFIVDRICAKFELAKRIYLRYDTDFKFPVTNVEASAMLLLELAKLLLQWNKKHRDYKVLNTLLNILDNDVICDQNFADLVSEHRRDMLCDE